LLALVEELEPRYAAGNMPSIALVSPYKQQVELLKELLPTL
jgi:hypothetical protein